MKSFSYKRDQGARLRIVTIVIGITVNVLLSFLLHRFGLPMFLDTIGTIIVSALGGYFPGILTAVLTNAFCTLFNGYSFYFAFINAIIALLASLFFHRRSFKKLKNVIYFILLISFVCGTLSTYVQWGLFGKPQNPLIGSMVDGFVSASGLNPVITFFMVNLILNIIDKGITTAAACAGLHLIPAEKARKIDQGAWQQRPLSKDERRSIREWSKGIRNSVRFRMIFTVSFIAVVMVISIGGILIRLYFNNIREERTLEAWNTVHMAAGTIDPDRIESFLEKGRDAQGYRETYGSLNNILRNSSNIKYLYVGVAEEDGFRFVFDMEGDDQSEEAYTPGVIVPYEDAFADHLDDLKAGAELDPIESNDSWGWLISVYYPLRNRGGRTVCYVCADVSVEYLNLFLKEFLLKTVLMSLGILILVIAFALWMTGIYSSYPIMSMAYCVDHFTMDAEDQEKLDNNVKSIRSLDIHTGDETEKLYEAICDMTIHQAEQMRDIRRLSDSTARMQDGLIITMADMVENRDSDTGAHIQKTAAYVKIIVEGLLKKGYYTEKITPKFISDVVRSAPLHDVGKINIPDGILNKPGKLSPEEYEIMKTHTIVGKKIMENAISTIKGENYLKEARNMAAYHHERWDGKGYPEALHGEVIPLSARIMSVADVFDALTSPRIYKPAFPLEKALEIMNEGSGTQFDPKCIEVFMESLPEVKVILKKYNQDA
ncbi:MAG: HD domain-containing protein [Lachnospiraceae bacterium]|nr:HD domain-containing protein [Lachnospiraceae bacterium]